MKIYFFVLAALFCLAACHSINTKFKEKINNSDSVAVVYFKANDTLNTDEFVRIIKDKNSIDKLCNYIVQTPTNNELENCKASGELYFFKRDSALEMISFRMSVDNCMSFSFMQDAVYNKTILSADAKQFLELLKK